MEYIVLALVVLVPIVLLVSGIMLIRRRATAPWKLWAGIGLLVLFGLSLIAALPFLLLLLLFVTGGSFS